jgi:hypothetical protein
MQKSRTMKWALLRQSSLNSRYWRGPFPGQDEEPSHCVRLLLRGFLIGVLRQLTSNIVFKANLSFTLTLWSEF